MPVCTSMKFYHEKCTRSISFRGCFWAALQTADTTGTFSVMVCRRPTAGLDKKYSCSTVLVVPTHFPTAGRFKHPPLQSYSRRAFHRFMYCTSHRSSEIPSGRRADEERDEVATGAYSPCAPRSPNARHRSHVQYNAAYVMPPRTLRPHTKKEKKKSTQHSESWSSASRQRRRRLVR